jgi:hypothetical protein
MIDGPVEINWKMLWDGFGCWERGTNILRMPKQPFPLQIMIDQKQQEYGIIKCLCSRITNDARCTREISSRIAMAKVHIQPRKRHFVWC